MIKVVENKAFGSGLTSAIAGEQAGKLFLQK
jgi:hypothetical protein